MGGGGSYSWLFTQIHFPFELGIYYGPRMLRWHLHGFHAYDKPLVILGHKSKVISPKLLALLVY